MKTFRNLRWMSKNGLQNKYFLYTKGQIWVAVLDFWSGFGRVPTIVINGAISSIQMA